MDKVDSRDMIPRHLSKDLGPKNEYDTAAGQAYQEGERLGELSLIGASLELSRMTVEIPFHSPQFRQVEKKLEKVREKIRNARRAEMESEVLDECGCPDWGGNFVKDGLGRHIVVIRAEADPKRMGEDVRMDKPGKVLSDWIEKDYPKGVRRKLKTDYTDGYHVHK